MDGARTVGFYHIIGTTLNQFHKPDDAKQSQHNFIMTPLFCGSEPTGYLRTSHFAEGWTWPTPRPSQAQRSVRSICTGLVRFMMLVLNFRLGQWYPNPAATAAHDAVGHAHPPLPPPSEHLYLFGPGSASRRQTGRRATPPLSLSDAAPITTISAWRSCSIAAAA